MSSTTTISARSTPVYATVAKSNDHSTRLHSNAPRLHPIELTGTSRRQLNETENDVVSSEPLENRFLITWNGDSDPEQPLNWPARQKWSVTLTMSAIGFVAILSSSVVAPALQDIAKDLKMSPTEAQMAMSVYVLGLAFSPLVLGPVSEMVGRQPVMHATNAWFLIWTLAGGLARNKATMMTARYFAGTGGSLVYAIGAGVLSDVWRPQQRGKSLGLYSAVPLLGTAIGPVIGGVATQQLSWRWIFYIVAMLQGIVMVVSVFSFRETYAPVLLQRRALSLRKSTSNPAWHTRHEIQNAESNKASRIFQNLSRPIRLLLTQPILQLTTVYAAFDYGVLYLVLSTFATVWQERYRQSLVTSGLNYIAFVIGELTAAFAGAALTDRIWRRLRARKNNQIEPEYRIPLMLPGTFILAMGLLMYGWSAQVRSFWLVLDIGVALIGCGLLLISQAV